MEVLLNVLAIFSITFAVANIFLSALFSMVSQQVLNIQVDSRKLLLWSIVLLPWLVSLATSGYLFTSYHTNGSLTGYGFPHWHHMADFQWYSWHGVSVIALVSYVVFVLARSIKNLLLHKKEVSALLNFANEKEAGVYQLETDNASAFTTGFFTKKSFVTTGLINQTSAEEYDVVIMHEKAHCLANDPFKKWLFSLQCAFFIKPIGHRLKLHMTLAMEQAADNAVIESGTPKLFVASTLVKIAKFNAQSSVLKSNDLVVNFGADVLEQRIYFLLDRLKLAPVHKGITVILLILLVVISTTSIDGIHHFMETLFRH